MIDTKSGYVFDEKNIENFLSNSTFIEKLKLNVARQNLIKVQQFEGRLEEFDPGQPLRLGEELI